MPRMGSFHGWRQNIQRESPAFITERDWWGLTNFDTNVINLRGYRFDDYPRILEGAIIITNDLIIQPG